MLCSLSSRGGNHSRCFASMLLCENPRVKEVRG